MYMFLFVCCHVQLFVKHLRIITKTKNIMPQWLVHNIFSKFIRMTQFLSPDTGLLLYIVIFRLVIYQLVYLIGFSLSISLSSGSVILRCDLCFHFDLISLELYYRVQFYFFILSLYVFLVTRLISHPLSAPGSIILKVIPSSHYLKPLLYPVLLYAFCIRTFY